ncbi:MAG: zinc-ribbon domain-containing protein, partial [bacterium]
MKTLLSEHPEISSEWHQTKNGDLKPSEVTYSSNKKVWWLCPKGHSYDSFKLIICTYYQIFFQSSDKIIFRQV